MVLFLVLLDACDYGGCPLDYQVLKAISLVQICIHELLHGLPGQMALLTFLVKLCLLRINIIYQIPKLTQSKCSGVRLGNRRARSTVFAEKLSTCWLTAARGNHTRSRRDRPLGLRAKLLWSIMEIGTSCTILVRLNESRWRQWKTPSRHGSSLVCLHVPRLLRRLILRQILLLLILIGGGARRDVRFEEGRLWPMVHLLLLLVD